MGSNKGLVCLCVFLASSSCKKESSTTASFQHAPQAIASSKEVSDRTSESVAVLLDPVSDVKVRSSGDLVWKDGIDHMLLMNRTGVKTGPTSSDIIQFNDQTSIKMGEKSVIIVVSQSRKPHLDQAIVNLPSGVMDGKLKNTSDRVAELEVRTNRGWIRARTQKGEAEPHFTVSISGNGKMHVQSQTGNLQYVTQSGTKAIHSHEGLSISAYPHQMETNEIYDTPPAVAAADIHSITEMNDDSSNSFTIESPANNAELDAPEAEIRGKLLGKLQAFLNGTEIHANSSGRFLIHVPINEGANVFTFQVIGPHHSQVKYRSLNIIRRVTGSP